MNNVLTHVLDVFSQVGAWMSEAFTSLQPMFYNTESGLTFLGTLSIAGLSVSVIFLLIGVITNFLRFRA